MNKDSILDSIKNCKNRAGRNSMGVSESFYDAYYLTSKCFTIEELSAMSESELINLIRLANFATEVFY